MSFEEKIDKVLKENKLGINTKSGLEAFLEISVGSISKPINQGKQPGLKTIKKIIEGLSINKIWWETGKGALFTEKVTSDEGGEDFPGKTPARDGKNTFVNEDESSLYSVEGKTNAKYALLDQIEVKVVEVKAWAGYLRGFNDPEYMETLPRIYVSREFERGGNFMCFRIGGDSMNDGTVRSFLDGDVVLCRELYQKYWTDKIKNIGKPYIIVHEEGILFKEIVKHNVEAGIITCHSWNTSPEYEDFELNLKDVKQLWYYKRLVERK